MVQSANKVPSVLTAMLAVAAELEKRGIEKSRDNTHQKFKFRGVDDVVGAVSELLVLNKLILLPEVLDLQFSSYETKKGDTAFRAIVKYKLTFVSVEDASERIVITYGEGADQADKATNKAQSYAFKDAILKTFCVPVEGRPEDRDPDYGDLPASAPNPRQAPRVQKEEKPVVREQHPETEESVKPAKPSKQAAPPADDEGDGEETIEQALARLVKDPRNRQITEAKVLQAYNAMHLGEIAPEDVGEAIKMVENFVKQQRERQAKK